MCHGKSGAYPGSDHPPARHFQRSGTIFVIYTVTSSTTAISAIPAIRP